MSQSSRIVRAVLFFAILGGIVLATYVFAGSAIGNMLTSPSERFRKEGDGYLAENRLPEAVLAYRQAVEVDPANPAALTALSSAYRDQGRLRMADRYASRLPAAPAPSRANPVDSSFLKLRWVQAATETTPTGGWLQGDVLIIAFEDGTIQALRTADGELRWNVHLNQAVTSAPSVSPDSVWVGTIDGKLHRLSILDGKPVWEFDTHGPIYAPPAVDGSRVYLPSGDGTLYALSSANGEEAWHFKTQGQLHSTPVLFEGKIFFGSTDAKFYALDANSGRPVWQDGILTSGMVEAQALAAEGRVVFGAGDGRVYALAPASGGQYWRYSTPDAVFTPPILMGGTVYIASSGQTLSAVDFISGQRIWQTDLPSVLRNPPAVTEKYIYQIADADPNLYVIDRATGKLVEQVNTGDWTSAGPWIEGQSLYLLGKDGAVIAYQLLK